LRAAREWRSVSGSADPAGHAACAVRDHIAEFHGAAEREVLAGSEKNSCGVRHPPQTGWLDELGRLKGGRAWV